MALGTSCSLSHVGCELFNPSWCPVAPGQAAAGGAVLMWGFKGREARRCPPASRLSQSSGNPGFFEVKTSQLRGSAQKQIPPLGRCRSQRPRRPHLQPVGGGAGAAPRASRYPV